MENIGYYIIAVFVGALIGLLLGIPTGYDKGVDEMNAKVACQTECHAKAMEMLHIVWENHPRIWKEIEQSQAFQEYDSIVGHDWEDFYYLW